MTIQKSVIDDLIASIESAADDARVRIVGDPVRVVEYQSAELDAKAYVAANYEGDVPVYIQCWADAKHWTPREACDDILGAATAWRAALINIRVARLHGKQGVRDAALIEDDEVAFQTARAATDTAIAQLKYILSLTIA
jgi:hypothetical protein